MHIKSKKRFSSAPFLRLSTLTVVSALAIQFLYSAEAKAKVFAESVPGEFVVKLKPNAFHASSVQRLSTELNSYVKSTIRGQNVVVVRRATFENIDAAIKSLSANEMVMYAEPNYIYHMNKTPNDSSFGLLWGMSNAGQKDSAGQVGVKGIDINAEKAWDIQTGTKEKIIAVIDTGIDYNHPDLKDNVWTNEAELKGKAGVDDDNNGVIDDIHGYNAVTGSGDPLDDQGHGSHCTGTIAGKADNRIGVAGVNWNARVMAVKFLDKGGSGSLENAIKAIDYATKMGASVMSNSWGGGGFSQTLLDSITNANKAGAIFIAAAGNDSNNNDSAPSYPGSYQIANVVSVAAIDNKGALANFSNYGRKSVHIAAPGVNILSTTGGKYDTFSGTSMATPHVAGVAALLWANEPTLTAVEIKQRLLSTARPLITIRGKVQTGLVDAYAALTNTTPPLDINDPVNWVTQPLDIKSASPYLINTNQTFDVSVPGAKEFALYFQTFATEPTYDTVTILDASGKVIQIISGTYDDSFSLTISGNAAKIIFKSDDSVNKNGWVITKAAYR